MHRSAGVGVAELLLRASEDFKPKRDLRGRRSAEFAFAGGADVSPVVFMI